MTNPLRRFFLVVVPLVSACGPDLARLHEGAMAGKTQAGAALFAAQTTVIEAPRHRVFATLSNFAGWPAWQPAITHVTPPPSLEAGAPFTWMNDGTTISSRLALVVPDEALGWTGTVATASAAHVWRFSSPTPDTTRVDVEESMDGFLLTVFYSQEALDAEMTRSLSNLKAAAEATP